MTGDVIKKIAEASVELARLEASIRDARRRLDWNAIGIATCRRRDLVFEVAEVLTRYGEDLLDRDEDEVPAEVLNAIPPEGITEDQLRGYFRKRRRR